MRLQTELNQNKMATHFELLQLESSIAARYKLVCIIQV
jgi:hypothetical protein